MTLEQLVQEAHANAKAKGFWDAPDGSVDGHNIPEKLALIHSEVSEALEALRDGSWPGPFEVNGKPEGFAIELADAVIRIADLCGHLNIDLGAAIERKMVYNATRGHKHGKAF